jgi:hypothetical protein
MSEEVRRWQNKLEENFSHKGVVGGFLLPHVMNQERVVGDEFIAKYKGHRVLIDSFLDFFALTLYATLQLRNQQGWPKGAPWYAPCVLEFINQFRGLRAAEVLSINGYPLEAYSLQRNLKDQALFMGAVMNNMTSFSALEGFDKVDSSKKWTEEDRDKIFWGRQEEEKSVVKKMIGKNSNLGEENILELEKWSQLFNSQVHRSRVGYYREMEAAMVNQSGASIGPRFDEDANAVFLNRSHEIGWMMLRALPFLQLDDAPFDEEWGKKWAILDESFRYSIEGLGKLGKKISFAFIALIENKFSSSPSTRYVERP